MKKQKILPEEAEKLVERSQHQYNKVISQRPELG
jgi:hypothetical protein